MRQLLQEGGGGYLCHAACNVFQEMLFVRFESDSPTIFKGKRDRVI